MDNWICFHGHMGLWDWNIHLVIDNTVYFIGASLKDFGKKLFAFSKMEIKHTELIK